MHADLIEEQRTMRVQPAYADNAAMRSLARRLGRVGGRIVVIGLGLVMLLWVGLIDGRPSVFSDTALYYSQAEYLAGAVGLVSSRDDRVPAGDPTALPAHPGEANVSAAIDGGRSPIYGLFVYGLERLGGLWLVAGAQAAMVAGTLYILFKAAAPALGDVWYLLWMGAVSLLTSAPAFSSFIMPDVLGGVAGVAGLTVLIYWDRLSAASRTVIVAMLVFGLSVHRANLLAVTGAAVAGAVWLAWARLPAKGIAQRVGVTLGAAAASWLVVSLAFLPINHRAGETVRGPPFLMARLLADGPGRRYLQHACDRGSPFVLCRFSRLPPEDSDTLLWSHRAGRGLFGVSDYATQLKLEAQERSFVVGALTYAPADELAVAATNTVRQLGMTHVQSPLADPARYLDDGYWRRTSLPRIIPGARGCLRRGRCASPLSQPIWALVQDVTTTLSLLGLIAFAGVFILRLRWSTAGGAPSTDATSQQDRRLLGLILLAAAFVLCNAVVCGALSAPVPRYQARLIWMIPALALLIGGVFASRWRARITARFDLHKIIKSFQLHSEPATYLDAFRRPL